MRPLHRDKRTTSVLGVGYSCAPTRGGFHKGLGAGFFYVPVPEP